MTSNVLEFHPRNYRRGRVANLRPAILIDFTEHLPPVERADALDRQADRILALTTDVYLSAFNLAIHTALCIAGLHPQQDGASACKKIDGRETKHLPNEKEPA